MWVILFKKVWDIDALRCPMCGGRMKAISVIEHTSVIRRILEYLERRLPRLSAQSVIESPNSWKSCSTSCFRSGSIRALTVAVLLMVNLLRQIWHNWATTSR